MADFNCIKCGNPNRAENPNGTEIVELTGIDDESKLQQESRDYLIVVCPSCATSNLAIMKKKTPKKSESKSNRRV